MAFPNSMRCVITGAASGLGRAFCLELAGRGARIIVSDINEEGASETAHMVREMGGDARVLRADVSTWADHSALREAAVEAWGGTDLLINNAGVAVGGLYESTSLEDWQWIMNINLWGPIYGCRAFVPEMKKRQSGYIVNVASVAGLVSPPFMGPYNITKAGVVSLSETLHSELSDQGIHVTALCPSFFQTNIANSGRGSEAFLDKTKALINTAMAVSKVQAPEVAKAALSAVESGAIYAVPMNDARLFWRLKRAFPQTYYGKVLPGVARLANFKKRLGL